MSSTVKSDSCVKMYRFCFLLICWASRIALSSGIDCSCLINKECVNYVLENPPSSFLNCSNLTHFERFHQSRRTCNRSERYHCAWDLQEEEYGEICTKPIALYPGFRPTREGGLNQGHCSVDRYQPFFIESNLTFQCIYEKSTCIEEGQKIYSNGSIYEDRSCFCDFENGYAFVNKTSNKTHCVPSKEDCTCYKKICPENSAFLNTGYICIQGMVDSLQGEVGSERIVNILEVRTLINEVYSNIKYNKVSNTSNNKTGLYIVFMVLLCGAFHGPVRLHSDNIVLFHEDNDTKIECTVTGPSLIRSVEWFKDGEIVSEKNYTPSLDVPKLTLFIRDPQKKDEGVFKCVVTNYCRISSERSVNFMIFPSPTVLDEWKAKDTKIVETDAMSKVREILQSSNCVTVVGRSGSGKSTVLRHIALALHAEKESYEVFPSFSPEDVRQHFDRSKKQVFVFDDVFGKYAIDLHTVDEWIFFMHDMKSYLDHGNLRMMFSCRSHITNHPHFQKLKLISSASCTCNIHDFPLSPAKQEEVANKYLKDKDVKIIMCIEPSEIKYIDIFPLLCESLSKLLEMDEHVKVDEFFKTPFEVLWKVFQHIKSYKKEIYALMSLFLVCNNVLEKQVFGTKPFKDKCRIIAHYCDIPNFSEDDIRSLFIKLQKYFTKVSGNNYKIFHDKIFDAVVSFYGEDLFGVILDIAHSDIIRDRFHLKSINEECEIAFPIKVPEEKEEQYFKRLFVDTNREIFNNEVTFTAFANRQLQYQTYRDKFIKYCTKNEELKKHILLLSYKATSPLLEVAAQGYDDILNMLIKMHLDVNVFDENGDTPLHKAAAFGHIGSLNLLLKNGADPNRLNKSAQSPLFKAVERGYTNVARKLLKKNVEVNLKNSTGETTLYVASREGHTSMTKLLLQNKADPTIFDEYIGSPLHISSKENFTDIMQLLLEEGADPNLSTNHIESPLYIASLNGKTEAVKLLIKNEADLDKCGKDGRSPLCKAAWNGYKEAVEILLKNKADPNKISEYNESPLYKAARCGHLEIVKMLLENGANVDQACRDGRTPLYKSAWKNKHEVVQVLLDNGADPNLWSKYFGTPLYRAAKEHHLKTVELLLENRNTDVNLKSKDGETALFAASKFGYRNVIQRLVDNGADLNIKNNEGKTPIDAASEMEHSNTVKLLKDILKNC
ncbi:uncharacterized protein LOC127698382 isoform X2 [Mytilus californianus]|uniref:uncharacterized protein LOC127698382 isoform X2 n=1 Tax=Mytilus californianus TaxID=6549 RepID=UPI002245CF7D|nr:uncharacterized protein LOC127698382 isoform X2 [Mytilus californianus]